MPELVFQYRQGADIRWYASEVLETHAARPNAPQAGTRLTREGGQWVTWAPTSTSFGVCFGLSTWWIIKKANGEDFLGWLRPGHRAGPNLPANAMPGAGPIVEEVREVQLSQRGKDPIIKLATAVDRIRLETDLVSRDKTLVKQKPLSEKAGFSLIIITGRAAGAAAEGDLTGESGFNHAMALQVVARNEVHLFDPNRGEIRLSCVAEANQFIQYLCTHPTQYGLAHYEMKWAAVAGRRIHKGSFD